MDKAFDDIVSIGISSVELWEGMLDPFKSTDAEFKSWERKFAEAGVQIHGYTISPQDDWTK
jgi:hypothetical protein